MSELFIESVEVVDRSTLERYAICPQRAFLIAKHGIKSESDIASTGSEVHEVISKAVKERQTNATPSHDLRARMIDDAQKSRPDVQPETCRIIRTCNWDLANYLCFNPETNRERHPDDLLIYDGGEKDRSGQVSADLTVDGVTYRCTCEVDLGIATASDAEIEVTDWKAGFKWWTATMVKGAFQPRFYSWVLFNWFPKVNVISFRIFMCAESQFTSPVEFRREDMFEIQRQIESALRLRAATKGAESKDVPAWPTAEKCAICPAAKFCVLCHGLPEAEVAIDPEMYLDSFVAHENLVSNMKANLTKYVRSIGHDLESGPNAFGTNAPKTERAKSCSSYSLPVVEADISLEPKKKVKKSV